MKMKLSKTVKENRKKTRKTFSDNSVIEKTEQKISILAIIIKLNVKRMHSICDISYAKQQLGMLSSEFYLDII